MTSSIIARAEEFFYFEDDLTQSIEAWASSRCESFGKKEDEHPLEHQQMFFEYQEFFENIMHSFITNEGYSIQDFYQEVSRELDSRLDKDATFASVLLSAVDFAMFCDMMNDVREGRGVVFCPPLVSLDEDFYGDQAEGQDMQDEFGAMAKDSYGDEDMDQYGLAKDVAEFKSNPWDSKDPRK